MWSTTSLESQVHSNPCKGPIYESNITVQSFTKDYYYMQIIYIKYEYLINRIINIKLQYLKPFNYEQTNYQY